VLRQFGLVENDKLDHFLVVALGQPRATVETEHQKPSKKRLPRAKKATQSSQMEN